MPITPQHIRTTLADYLDAHPEDKDQLAAALDLLDAAADPTSRKQLPAHATASALVTDPQGRVLHIHHRALNTWLRPGGHLEESDSELAGAALRELAEETGIRPQDVVRLAATPIHVDVHPIPANPAKDEPEHQHIDFRFLFTTTVNTAALQTEEVTDAAWRDIDTIGGERLRTRITKHRTK